MEHCKQLLKLCGADIFERNAFRLLDVNVDQKDRQIKRREKDLISAIEHDDLIDEFRGMLCPDPLPTHEELSQASKALSDPQQRFIYEFFWFWPIEWGNSRSDEILKLIRAGDGEKAQEHWQALAEGDDNAALVAKHNLAVLAHFWVLQTERDILKSENELTLTAEKRQELDQYWYWAFDHWEYLCDSEEFWEMLIERVRDLKDERLTKGFVRRFAKTLPIAFDNINADMAAAYCKKKIYARAKDHIKIMVATNSGDDDVTFSLRRVTDPLHIRIDKAIETATENLTSKKDEGLDRCNELYYTVSEMLEVLQTLLGESSQEFNDVRDQVAESMRQCLVAYGNHTKNWSETLPMMEQALNIAIGKKTVENVKRDLDAYRENDRLNLCWYCQKNVRSENSDYKLDMYRIITFNVDNILTDPDTREAIASLSPEQRKQVADTIVYGGTPRITRSLSINVPRCPDCKKIHESTYKNLGCNWIIGLILLSLLFPPLLFVLPVVGVILGQVFYSKRLKKLGTHKKEYANEFVVVKELIKKKWTIGKPPAAF